MASSGTVSSPVKDGRRVLGDKTTNASWTPAKDHFNPSKHLVDNRVSSTDVPDSPKKPFSPSQKAGRKRTIDELEDPGNKLSTSQSLPKWTVPPTQDKFRIFEDSGITLNEYCSQAPTSPTELGSPTSCDGELDSGKNLLQAGSVVVSSEGNPFSGTPARNTNSETSVPSEPQARRLFVQEKAHLLRNRIQTAMRHVEGKSLDRKLSEYEAHRASLSRHALSVLPTVPSSLSSAAAMDDTRPQSRKLLPPVSLRSGPSSPQRRLSTPPFSAENTSPDTEMSTPRQQDYLGSPQTPTQPIQLSSPPETVTHSEIHCPSRKLSAQPTSSENAPGAEVH